MLNVCDVTNWGNSDIATLEKWISIYAKLIGDKYDHRAISVIKSAIVIEYKFPVTDINVWYKVTITLIFYHITSHLKHTSRANRDLISRIHKLEREFSPSINYLATSFCNCFDYVDFEQSREKIFRQAEGKMLAI